MLCYSDYVSTTHSASTTGPKVHTCGPSLHIARVHSRSCPLTFSALAVDYNHILFMPLHPCVHILTEINQVPIMPESEKTIYRTQLLSCLFVGREIYNTVHFKRTVLLNLREFRYVVIIDGDFLYLVVEIAGIVLTLSCR